MASSKPSRDEQSVRNEVRGGKMTGNVVQAGSVHGGVHFYTHQRFQPVPHRPAPSMQIALIRWLGWGGVGWMGLGEYAGVFLAGLIAIVSGHAFGGPEGDMWVKGLPGFAVFGGGGGLIVAFLTRRRVAPRLRYRTGVFVLIGLITFPVAIVGPTPPQEDLAAKLFIGGGVVGILIVAVRRALARRQ